MYLNRTTLSFISIAKQAEKSAKLNLLSSSHLKTQQCYVRLAQINSCFRHVGVATEFFGY